MAWAPTYCTSDELKAYTRIPDGDTLDDVQVALAIEAASRAIDVHTNRQFGSVSPAQERFYAPRWDRRRCLWVIDTDDLMSTTGLVIESSDEAITAYTLHPVNAAVKGRPWTGFVVDSDSAVTPTASENVSVTALWGWTAVPDAVKQACLLQANRLLSRRGSPYGVAGSPDLGNELRLLSRVDPDVAVILTSYVKRMKAL